MKVLFICPALTVYDNQSRVMGWRSTPASREELRKLKALIPRLRELGAERVVCSDLDGQSGWLIARKLGVPCDEWRALRRLNVGKHHGMAFSKFDELLRSMREQWQTSPDVPIQGGDSQTSYNKRLAGAYEQLTKLGGTVVVVAAPDEIARLTGSRGAQHGHIYQIELPDGAPKRAHVGKSN